jgi:hypothetical protein
MIPGMRRRVIVSICLVLAASCVDRLPEQDLRILTATPAYKLSASDLWKDFQADASAARSRYFGKALDVSDAPTAIEPNAPGGPRMLFAQSGERGVVARLLDDKAPATVKEAKVGTRLRLRCFAEGLDSNKDVVLKSCYRPE